MLTYWRYFMPRILGIVYIVRFIQGAAETPLTVICVMQVNLGKWLWLLHLAKVSPFFRSYDHCVAEKISNYCLAREIF